MNAIVAFAGIAYGLSIALSLAVGLTGGAEGALYGLRYLSMIIPAVAVVIVSSTMNQPARIDWDRLPPKYIPIALLLIPIVSHAAMLPVTAAYEGGLPWEDWLSPQTDGLYHVPPPRNWGTVTFGVLVTRIAINAVVGLIVVSILAFFEEVGWRGWLQPRLVDRLGVGRGVLATSIIWALWHVPYMLSGVQHIEGVTPLALAMTLPLGIMAVGLVIGWLWLRTESIWIVSLAHGSLNAWGQYAFKYMRPVGRAPDAVVGAAGGLAVFVLGVLLLNFNRKGRP